MESDALFAVSTALLTSLLAFNVQANLSAFLAFSYVCLEYQTHEGSQ